MRGPWLALVLVGSLMAGGAAPLGAAAAQLQPLKPGRALADCGPSCEGASLIGTGEASPEERPRALAPTSSDACPIRASCRTRPTPQTAVGERYVEPAPESPAPPSSVRSGTGSANGSGTGSANGGATVLGVPVYAQIWSLDCETAALQMALAYTGHFYSQPALFALENADLRPPVLDSAGNIVQWGDPYTNFVGNVQGSEIYKTGYGVYWPVILSIARSHGAPGSYGGEGLSPQVVYAALAARHPVEIWINYGFTTWGASTWRAWDGRTIRYTLHEHAVTLTGVSDNAVLVNDPWPGHQYWVGKAAFEASWAVFGNMAVIVQ